MSALKKTLGAVAAVSATVGAIHTINTAISALASKHHHLKNDADMYSWKDGDIYYRTAGTGDPILLVHDLDCAASSYEWNEVFATFAETHTVYAVDLPGCGRSVRPNITFTNYYYVLFLLDFIQDVIGEPVDVLASGYSSSFAVMAKVTDPDRIKSITAVNPLSPSDLCAQPAHDHGISRILINVPIISTFMYNLQMSKAHIKRQFSCDGLDNMFHVKHRFAEAYYESAHRENGSAKFLLFSLQHGYLTIDIRRAVSSMGNGLKIIYGENAGRNVGIAAEYQKLNSSVKALAVSRTSLYPQIERPHAFTEVYAALQRL